MMETLIATLENMRLDMSLVLWEQRGREGRWGQRGAVEAERGGGGSKGQNGQRV